MSNISHERFTEALAEAMSEDMVMTIQAATRVLTTPGAYGVFSELYNNAALELCGEVFSVCVPFTAEVAVEYEFEIRARSEAEALKIAHKRFKTYLDTGDHEPKHKQADMDYDNISNVDCDEEDIHTAFRE